MAVSYFIDFLTPVRISFPRPNGASLPAFDPVPSAASNLTHDRSENSLAHRMRAVRDLTRTFRRPLAALALLCALAAVSRAAVIRGRVVGIADGDTITVLDASRSQHRIRLQGIDAPESRQAFSARSKQHLADLVFNKEVAVGWEKRDRYGRVLGKVLVGGRDACLAQVQAGMAWHYKYYENEQSPGDRRLYAEAELEARRARRGLWADSDPVPPWDFRRGGGGRRRPEPSPGLRRFRTLMRGGGARRRGSGSTRTRASTTAPARAGTAGRKRAST